MKTNIENEEEKLRALTGENENLFSVPSGYFQELPVKIRDIIASLPDFEKSGTVNSFEVPEGYFDKLPVIISDKISNQKIKDNSWFNIILNRRIVFPVALAATIFFAGLYFYKQKYIVNPVQKEFTADDLRNSSYIQCIDEDLFVKILSDQKESANVDSLEQYLIDNHVDLALIENNL